LENNYSVLKCIRLGRMSIAYIPSNQIYGYGLKLIEFNSEKMVA
jgi:hypothetical protein